MLERLSVLDLDVTDYFLDSDELNICRNNMVILAKGIAATRCMAFCIWRIYKEVVLAHVEHCYHVVLQADWHEVCSAFENSKTFLYYARVGHCYISTLSSPNIM